MGPGCRWKAEHRRLSPGAGWTPRAELGGNLRVQAGSLSVHRAPCMSLSAVGSGITAGGEAQTSEGLARELEVGARLSTAGPWPLGPQCHHMSQGVQCLWQ